MFDADNFQDLEASVRENFSPCFYVAKMQAVMGIEPIVYVFSESETF